MAYKCPRCGMTSHSPYDERYGYCGMCHDYTREDKMTEDIQKYADAAMFQAAPMQAAYDERGNIVPKVHLLWMTPDPLGAVAAMGRMYKGIPTYSLGDITDEERQQYFNDVLNTHLRAPLEAIKLHFFIEGVTRSFTHQMVRQRTAVYAQESLRFAVKDEPWAEVCSVPPSITESEELQVVWDGALGMMQDVYDKMIERGVPAEDARGLMPHAMTTRLNYVTDLRNLAEHAGNRLCTQAQFEWRAVFLGIVQAIRDYGANAAAHETFEAHEWQYQVIAESPLFRPVCYQQGKCPFKASFDRFCTIRGRVDAFERHGVPSQLWDARTMPGSTKDGAKFMTKDGIALTGIFPAEWLVDSTAARQGPGGHD